MSGRRGQPKAYRTNELSLWNKSSGRRSRRFKSFHPDHSLLASNQHVFGAWASIPEAHPYRYRTLIPIDAAS